MRTNNAPSRRDFLKSSSVLVAGASLAGGLSVARSAHAAGSDVIKVALIGAGGRGVGAASQLMTADKNLQLIAVADAFAERANGAVDRLKKQHGDQVTVTPDRVFVGLQGYQNAIATDADLVVLATPPGFRPFQYKAAVEAGKHVFMEKPCCVDAPGYRLLMEANKLADEKKLLVGVGLQRRHQPNYIETIQRLHDGAIGDVITLRVYWNGGGIWNRLREEGMTEMQYQVHNWYHFCWLSGDNIGEQHIHNIDIGNWVKGDEHPVEANGMGGCTARYLGENKGHRPDLRPPLRRVHVCRRLEDVQPMPPHERLLQQRFRGGARHQRHVELLGPDRGRECLAIRRQRQEGERAPAGADRPGRGPARRQALQRGLLRRQQQHDRRAGPHRQLLRQGRQVGRVGRQRRQRIPGEAGVGRPAPVEKDADGNYPIPMPGVYSPYA